MLKKIGDYRYILPRDYKPGMNTEGLIFADDELIEFMKADKTLDQIANAATLPNLIGPSLAMPDAHQGYGFCIGAVVASDATDGFVSAGAVGYDINCGVRLLRSNISYNDISGLISRLAESLFQAVPSGTGSTTKPGMLKLNMQILNEVLVNGALWAVNNGFGFTEDILHIEENGKMPGADPSNVSQHAKERGLFQLGTLGSGNHFLEVQYVSEIFDREAAEAFGLSKDLVTVMIHTGSRGLGHQVCTDYLEIMQDSMHKYKISVVDRELAYMPVSSLEGKRYLSAAAAAANFAFANRQLITHEVREVFLKFFPGEKLSVVYDIAHNMAKFEEHRYRGRAVRVLVHRKGATRSFAKGHPTIPDDYRTVGQPVLIPGSMGTSSYVLVGTESAMTETFGSSCHGAGRRMSRHKAKKQISAEKLVKMLSERGVVARGASKSGLTEEMPDAYKDVSKVVEVVHKAGIARKVAQLKPLAVIKG
ncbi:MAG: RtcB family protein [Candidatus Kryptoniota bacterium]